jgi:hypothetical protein
VLVLVRIFQFQYRWNENRFKALFEVTAYGLIVSRFYQRFASIHINTQVDLFADDTTLLAATNYNDINELNEKLSLDVSNVENWAITNKLPLNTTKTKTILISGKRLKAKLTPENQTLDIKLNDDSLEQAHTVKLYWALILMKI